MGKATLIGVVAMMFITTMMLYNMQLVSRETDRRQFDHMKEQVARELALTGRKLLLAHWVESGGTVSSAPFASVDRDGGTLQVMNYTMDDDMLDFTLRATYQGAVHEVRSKFRWNSFGIAPLQIKASDLHISISPWSTLDIEQIALDDQSVEELSGILVDELQIAGNLSELNLGMPVQETRLSNELANAGKNDIAINVFDDGMRTAHDAENGMFFPDQVYQAVSAYMGANPSQVQHLEPTAIVNGKPMNTSIKNVYQFNKDVTLSSDLSGKGVLIVEGSLVVPEGVRFQWEGLIIVRPPSTNMHPEIDFSGNVQINGSMVAMQEALPNFGHMDFTVMRDYGASWSSPNGSLYPWLKHTHDYSGTKGSSVVFLSKRTGVSSNEGESRFANTLGAYPTSDKVFLEIDNHAEHGRGIIDLELAGLPAAVVPMASGFPAGVADAVNTYRTKPFPISDLVHLGVNVNRLSSLKKMWDSEVPYPGCGDPDPVRHTDGPRCVAGTVGRMGSLNLRLFHIQTNGSANRVYDAALYWHRRMDEKDDFANEVNDLVTELQSTDTGLTITIGDNTTFVHDPKLVSQIGAFGESPLGMTHLGTWHTLAE